MSSPENNGTEVVYAATEREFKKTKAYKTLLALGIVNIEGKLITSPSYFKVLWTDRPTTVYRITTVDDYVISLTYVENDHIYTSANNSTNAEFWSEQIFTSATKEEWEKGN